MTMEIADARKRRAIAQHSEQAGLFAGRYEGLRQDRYGSCFAYSRGRLDHWLDRFLPPQGEGLRVLDVGCGTGHHMAKLRARGFEVSGVDASTEMLEHAAANNPGAEIEAADVEALPFPDASFDIATCIEVLRYLPDPSRCAREMARVLKPGGLCLATAVPVLNLNAYWLVNRVANVFPTPGLVRLKQFFTTSARLRRQFASAGFRETSVHGVYLGPINWVERIVPSALPPLLKRWEPVEARLSDRALLREISNMFLVRGVRG